MKKLIALLLTLSMVFTLAACSGSDKDTDEGTDTIETSSPEDTGTADEPQDTESEPETDETANAEKPDEIPEEGDTEENEKTEEPSVGSDKSETSSGNTGNTSSSGNTATGGNTESKPSSGGNTGSSESNTAAKPSVPETTPPEPAPSEPTPPETSESTAPDEDNTVDTAATMGESLKAQFLDIMGSGETYTAESIAQELLTNDVIQFMGMATPVTEGYLAGFSSDITGFKEGYVFGPMIGSIAFVGYVFSLEDGADVDGFVKTLEANADLRWNICVSANEMVSAASGNTVFFVMCP